MLTLVTGIKFSISAQVLEPWRNRDNVPTNFVCAQPGHTVTARTIRWGLRGVDGTRAGLTLQGGSIWVCSVYLMSTLSGMKRRWLRFSALLFLLVTAWLLWFGLYTTLLLGIGALSCILSLYLAHRVGFFNEVFSLQVIPQLPRYWGWLLLENTKSSLDVARIILLYLLGLNECQKINFQILKTKL